MHQTTIKRVGIIGAGELGQALGRAFKRTGIDNKFYDKQTDRSDVASLEELIEFSHVLLLSAPSWAEREIAEQIARKSTKPCIVVCFSKGVEGGFITMDQILAESLGDKHVYGLAYGPMIAEELAVGRQAATVLALSDMSLYDRLNELFLRIKVICEPSSDLQGLAVCGVLKNVYAIAFGMNDGLHLGANAKGKLAVMVLREIKDLLIHFEADPQLAEGLAGLGDLITTGITEASFNYRVGKTIAQGIADARIRSEGLNTLRELSRRVEMEAFPILGALEAISYQARPTKIFEQILLK